MKLFLLLTPPFLSSLFFPRLDYEIFSPTYMLREYKYYLIFYIKKINLKASFLLIQTPASAPKPATMVTPLTTEVEHRH